MAREEARIANAAAVAASRRDASPAVRDEGTPNTEKPKCRTGSVGFSGDERMLKECFKSVDEGMYRVTQAIGKRRSETAENTERAINFLTVHMLTVSELCLFVMCMHIICMLFRNTFKVL